MKLDSETTVLLTGANGGLGEPIARELAARKVKLALVAYPGAGLGRVKEEVEAMGCRAMTVQFDLRNREDLPSLLSTVARELGPVDVLINNAGVEYTSTYHELGEAAIRDTLLVNLEAPMMLTWLLLPGMLERKRGHVVNISSLAGMARPAFQEPYSATKAGLLGFTGSLRATYRGTGVSASAIVPGFVEAGIYARLKESVGHSAPPLLGACPPERVARAVVRAITQDQGEVYVSKYPVRPLLMLSVLSPLLGAWITRVTGANGFFGKAVEGMRRRRQKAGVKAP
jgi:short-subunit dehydrogenase